MPKSSSAFSAHFDAERAVNSSEKFGATLRLFFRDYYKKGFRVVSAVLLSAACAVAFVRIPRIISDLIDLFFASVVSSFASGCPDIDRQALLRLLVSLALTVLAFTVLSYIQNAAVVSFASYVAHSMRCRSFEKTGKIRVEYYDRHLKSETAETVTAQIDIVNQSVSLLLTQTLPSVFLIAAVIVMVFTRNIFLGMVTALIIPLEIVFELFVSYFESASRLNNPAPLAVPDISEFCRHSSLLQISGSRELINSKLAYADSAAASAVLTGRKYTSFRKYGAVFFSSVAIAACVILCAFSRNGASITIGMLLSVIIYLRRLEKPITDITSSKGTFSRLCTSLQTVYGFLNAPEEKQNGLPAEVKDSNTVFFDDVSFRYPSGRDCVISDFSASISDRGITAVSGVTAAGKTTLLKLLLRLYSPDSGSVRFNTTDIGELNNDEYRGLFSVITQEAEILPLTVEQNIVYPDSRVDYGKLSDISRFLGLDSVFADLTETVKTESISSGQVQMILLARAIYRDSRFVVLDESFSHVDSDYELFLIDRLKAISKTRGVIVISHRPAVLSSADKIIEITGG